MFDVNLLSKFIHDNKDFILQKKLKHAGFDYNTVDYSKTHELYGTCWRASMFYRYLINGKSLNYPIICACRYINEELHNHTYCIDQRDNSIIDLTSTQLDGIVDNTTEWYLDYDKIQGSTMTGYQWSPKDHVRYECQVPTTVILELGRRWKKITGTAKGLEFWIKERKEYENRNAKLTGKLPSNNVEPQRGLDKSDRTNNQITIWDELGGSSD